MVAQVPSVHVSFGGLTFSASHASPVHQDRMFTLQFPVTSQEQWDQILDCHFSVCTSPAKLITPEGEQIFQDCRFSSFDKIGQSVWITFNAVQR